MLLFNLTFLKRSSVAALMAGLIISLVLHLMPLGAKQWVGGGVVGTLFVPLEWPLYQARSLIASWKENRYLKEELTRLKLENSFLLETARENQTLRQSLQLKETSPFLLITARVASREPGWLAPELVIDKGARDSVRKGMVAVSTMGLAGLVAETGDDESYIRTLFDPDSRVSAIDLRSRVLGIFRSQGGLSCVLDRVALRSDVRQGDTLVSSGYGGIFPYGLMLGTVKEVRADRKKLVLDIEVQPVLDLDKLDQVLLIAGGQAPALPQLTPAPDLQDTMAGRIKRKRALARPEIKIRAPDIRIGIPDTIPLLPEVSP